VAAILWINPSLGRRRGTLDDVAGEGADAAYRSAKGLVEDDKLASLR
jgi:hypothetical protein